MHRIFLSGDAQGHTVHFRHLWAEEALDEERVPRLLEGGGGGCGPGGRPHSPGLLVGAQTAHSTIPGTAADTGVGGGEAADSTEGALGPGWGSRTGRQVVRTLGHTQVLQRQGGGAGSDCSAHPGIPAGAFLPRGVLPASSSHLLLQQGLKVFSEAKFKMVTSSFLLFLS